jgi:hypothetical protein
MSEHADALATELGGDLPDGFRTLPDDRLRWLVDTVKQGKVDWLADFDASIETTINNLPVMLRPAVRAVIGGKKK